MTTICLIRHGETDWNSQGKLQGRTDIPLNKNGMAQSEECGEFLKNTQWDVIITSPLQRAKQTAKIISGKMNGLPIIEMEEFIERSFGEAEGMTVQERSLAFKDKKYPNQEERTALTHRILLGIEKINQWYSGKKVILVAHGAVINAILAELSNHEIGYGKTVLKNACLSHIDYIKEEWKIRDYNQTVHLSQS